MNRGPTARPATIIVKNFPFQRITMRLRIVSSAVTFSESLRRDRNGMRQAQSVIRQRNPRKPSYIYRTGFSPIAIVSSYFRSELSGGICAGRRSACFSWLITGELLICSILRCVYSISVYPNVFHSTILQGSVTTRHHNQSCASRRGGSNQPARLYRTKIMLGGEHQTHASVVSLGTERKVPP